MYTGKCRNMDYHDYELEEEEKEAYDIHFLSRLWL